MKTFFFIWEEIDLCKRVKKNGGTIFLDKNIIINHEGANSVNKTNIEELEKIETGIGCGQLFISIKNIKVFLQL